MIVANKMDLPGAEENLRLLQNRFADKAIVPAAAERGEGIAELKDLLDRLLIEEADAASRR
jgi:50S ribosomal subunit-associated GTPase HflX